MYWYGELGLIIKRFCFVLGLEVGVSWGDVHCVVRHSGGQRKKEAEGICVGGGPESQDGDLHLSRPGQSGLIRRGIAESELDCNLCHGSSVGAGCQSGGITRSTWPSSLSWWPEGVARHGMCWHGTWALDEVSLE